MKKDFLKKVMAVVVVGAMTMGLVACGNGNSGNVSESTQNQENSVSGEEKETNAEGYLVGYSLNSMDSTMKQMADYFENVALERVWTPVLQNANGDVSTELNNCCKMLLAASGRAKSSNLFHRDPCVMSIVFFFCIFIVKQIPFLISTDDYNPGKSENQ